MICYKDRTFCSSDCTNKNCYRYFGEEQQKAAEEWWGAPNPPIAFSDFSNECPYYIEPGEKR